jgi:short-subunit dehydrogenase
MLTDHVFIITGASSGIGAATAIEAAKRGMDVVVTARREDKLNDVAARVRALNRRAEIVIGDVTEPGMSGRLLDAAARAFGRFDFVFANAGYGNGKPVLETTERELREMFEVNFFSGVDLLRMAAERLIAQGRPGHLMMCSSCLSKFTVARSGPYCATKAAQNHICRAMRLELRPHRIEVASVHPIGTETEFSEASAKRRGDQPHKGNTPGLFMQSSERVAKAVIRCLEHPRPEVWTSFTMRALAGFMLVWPRLGDAIVGRATRRE